MAFTRSQDVHYGVKSCGLMPSPLTLTLSPEGRGDGLLPLPFRERAGVRVSKPHKI